MSDNTGGISNTPLTRPSNTISKSDQSPQEGICMGGDHELVPGITPFETGSLESTPDNPLPPLHVQIDVEKLSDTIKSVAKDVSKKIATRVGTSQQNEFHDQLAAVCEKQGFSSVEEPHTQTLIARQASLYVLLKATLYEWYDHHRDLPSLSTTRHIGFLLEGVWADDGELAWCCFDDLITQLSYDTVEPIIAARDELYRSTQPAEDIGAVYAELLPKADRLTLGQFRTPPGPGELLRTWAVSDGDTVLDPGIGPGILSTTAHPDWTMSHDEKSVVGVDRSPLSVLMAKTTLRLYGQSSEVQETDFLQLAREDLPDIDSIVCNPPYTRTADNTAEYQSTIERYQEESDTSIQSKSPLYSHFITHATTLLDDGDRFALLIPAAWIHTRYGIELKQFLLDHYKIAAVIGPGSNDFITGADVRSVVVLLERTVDQATRNHNEIFFGKLTESVDWVAEHGRASQIISTITAGDVASTSGFEAVTRQQGGIDPGADWSQYIQATAITNKIRNHHLIAQLQDFAEVSYGRTTGYNKGFYLSNDEWDQENIEPAYRHPLLKSPKHHDKYRLTAADLDKSLFTTSANESALKPGAREYVEKLESNISEVENINSASGAWHNIQPKTSELTLPYGIHDQHVVCINTTAAHTDKRFLCIDSHEGVNRNILFALLNSTLGTLLIELHGVSRDQGVLEMKSVGELPMADLNQLTAANRAELDAAAETLKSQRVLPIQTQLGTADPEAVSTDTVVESQRAIDEIVLGDVLGLSQQEQEQVYREVLRRVAERIDGR